MWTCKRCKTPVTFEKADPEVDEHGIFFLCKACGLRNILVRVGPRGDDDPLDLAQSDEQW